MSNENTREQMMKLAAQNQRDEVSHQVDLSARLSVRLVELTGADETTVVRLLGKDFTATGAGAVNYRNALLGRAIKQFNMDSEGRDIDSPERQDMWQDLDQKKAAKFLNDLKLQEKEKLGVAYDALNGVDDAEREKVKNSLNPTLMM
jgi:hypothetical protein